MKRPFPFATAIATCASGVFVLTLWLSHDELPPQPLSADQAVSMSAPMTISPAIIDSLAPEEPPPLETPEVLVADHDGQMDDIADTFAANPALIDALEDERDADERTRAEAQQIVEAATSPQAPESEAN